MVTERRSGPIMLVTKVSTVMERNTEEDNSCGLTDRCTPVSSLKTTFTEMVFTLGQTDANMTANGRITKWTAKESSLGLTAENMKDSTLMIKRRDMECLRGLMAVSTMETGETGSSTVRVFIIQAAERLRRANGPTASVFAGSRKQLLSERLV